MSGLGLTILKFNLLFTCRVRGYMGYFQQQNILANDTEVIVLVSLCFCAKLRFLDLSYASGFTLYNSWKKLTNLRRTLLLEQSLKTITEFLSIKLRYLPSLNVLVCSQIPVFLTQCSGIKTPHFNYGKFIGVSLLHYRVRGVIYRDISNI